MNRRELIQAMLAAPLMATMPAFQAPHATVIYGAPLPGKFIWFGGLRETTTALGPNWSDGHTYSYDADFAVGVCEGPVQGIQRIWADGSSPMGRAAGVEIAGRAICIYDKRPRQADESEADYAARVALTAEIEQRLTVYPGTETQAPSPLIESYEGVGQVSAFRGLHYVTLKEFPVEQFENRVPDFWFESA